MDNAGLIIDILLLVSIVLIIAFALWFGYDPDMVNEIIIKKGWAL